MRSHFRVVIGSMVGISILMMLVFLLEGTLHVGGEGLLQVARYCVLLGPLIASVLSLVSVRLPLRQGENAEPWLKHERLAWTLIGCGHLACTIGEGIWRYYVAIGQSPFPSLADVSFSTFSPLVFVGLTLLTSSKGSQKRVFLILDSLIVMGALLSIAWFLLLGPLAQAPVQSPLGKFLSLYYPITDVALLSCLAFLLLRGSNQASRVSARRISLLMLAIGLCLYSAGDFTLNVLQNLGQYVEGTWLDLSWPLGTMIMATGIYLRRFLPRDTSEHVVEGGIEDGAERPRFGPVQLLPYLLLIILLVVLGFNVLSLNKIQQSIRPVLFIATLTVIGLVIVRQIMTMQENNLLMKEQVDTLKKLEKVYHDVENRKVELETGITHLKDVQTRLANGDVRARAQIMGGDLWPLATGLNLMADRMMRSEHNQKYVQKLAKAVNDLSLALEGRGSRIPVVLPASCLDIPEMHRLLTVLGLKPPVGTPPAPTPFPPTTFQQHQPSASSGIQNKFPHPTQRATP